MSFQEVSLLSNYPRHLKDLCVHCRQMLGVLTSEGTLAL